MKRLTSTNNANFVEDDFKRALYDIKKKLNRDTGSVSGLMKNVKEFDMEEDLDKYLDLSKKYIPRVTSNFQEVIYEVENILADLSADSGNGYMSPLYNQSSIKFIEMHQVVLLILYLNQKKYGWDDNVYDKIYYVFHEHNMMNYILTAILIASFPPKFLSTLDISILFTDDISEYEKLSDKLVLDILFNPDYGNEEYYDEYDINVGYVESKLKGIQVLERANARATLYSTTSLTAGNAFTINKRNPLDYMDVILLYKQYYMTSFPEGKVKRRSRDDISFRYPFSGSIDLISEVTTMTNHVLTKVTKYDPIMNGEVKRYSNLCEVLEYIPSFSSGLQPERDFRDLVRQTMFIQTLKRLEEDFNDSLRIKEEE